MKKYPNSYNNEYNNIVDLYEDELFNYFYSDIFKLKNHELIKRFKNETFNDINSYHFINNIYDINDSEIENKKSIFQR
jgi:16S rRNA C967 or C1407 C5-methylase (RsmB/RsmF family)